MTEAALNAYWLLLAAWACVTTRSIARLADYSISPTRLNPGPNDLIGEKPHAL